MRLIQGDCLEVLRTLESGSVDAIVTDPPWGVNAGRSDPRKGRPGSGIWGRAHRAYSSFDDDPDKVAALVQKVIPECLRVAKVCMVFPGTRCLWAYPAADDIGCVFSAAGAGRSRWGFCCCSPVLYYGKDPYTSHRSKEHPHGLGSRPNSFSSSAAAEKTGHPCNKPLAWMRWAVQRMSLPGQTVLDPFMGSGTTGVACVETGRNFIGIELDAAYFAIAEKRLAEAQAKTPLLRA